MVIGKVLDTSIHLITLCKVRLNFAEQYPYSMLDFSCCSGA